MTEYDVRVEIGSRFDDDSYQFLNYLISSSFSRDSMFMTNLLHGQSVVIVSKVGYLLSLLNTNLKKLTKMDYSKNTGDLSIMTQSHMGV